MQWHNGDSVPFFRFNSIPADGVQQHAVFTRLGGVSPAPFAALNLSHSVPDERTNVEANRALAYGTHGRRNDTLAHAHLVHGTEVARIGRADQGRVASRVDGLITSDPGCGLTMNFADCAPILLHDPERRAIGLGHSGWQGAVKDLPGALVRAMQQAFGSDPAALLAAVGPSIGPCCYEVGEPVISAVHHAFTNANELLLDIDNTSGGQPSAVGGHPHFDLPEANRRCLERAGVGHVEMAGLCTACRTDLFYSHRAEKGRTGRFGVIFLLL